MSILKRSKSIIAGIKGTNYTVANIAERNTLQNLVIEDQVLVLNDGDGKWAIYSPSEFNTDNTPSAWVKINDQDALENAITPAGLKSAYESNPDTNAFTDALLAKLNGIQVDDTDKQWWPKTTSVLELLDGPDRTVWVEQGTLDAPKPDFIGFIKVERGPNVGVGFGLLRATGMFSLEEHIYGRTPLGSSGWRSDLVYEIGEWVDLRPYLLPPYFFSSHRIDGNYPPAVRLMPDGEVQMRGVVDFNSTPDAPPTGAAFRVPEPFRPLMTGGGVCFSDAGPFWFGTANWIACGENNYSELSDHAHGNILILNINTPNPTENGAVEISGIRYYTY